jgi:hypothetical protein
MPSHESAQDQALARLAAAVGRLERAVSESASPPRAEDAQTGAALEELDRTISRLKALIGGDEGRG